MFQKTALKSFTKFLENHLWLRPFIVLWDSDCGSWLHTSFLAPYFHPFLFLIVQILYVSGNFSPRKLLRLDLIDKLYSNLVVLNVSFGEVFRLDRCNSRWKEQRKRPSPKNAFSWWKLMRSESSLKMTSKFRVYLFNPSRPNPG